MTSDYLLLIVQIVELNAVYSACLYGIRTTLNNGCFTYRLYTFSDSLMLNSSWNEKCFRQKL